MDHLLSKDFLGKSRPARPEYTRRASRPPTPDREAASAPPSSGRRPGAGSPRGFTSTHEPIHDRPTTPRPGVARRRARGVADSFGRAPRWVGGGAVVGRPRPLASGQSGRGRGIRVRPRGRRPGGCRPRPACSLTIRWFGHASKSSRQDEQTRGKWQIPSISTNVDPLGSRARPDASRWARQGIVTLKSGRPRVARRRRPRHRQTGDVNAAANGRRREAGAGPAWSSS